MITFYIMLQEAMMPATTFDCDKRARLCKQQPTFFINVDQPHCQLQGAKRQQED
jgi:hypothetical protein